jgi:hypothetical protein
MKYDVLVLATTALLAVYQIPAIDPDLPVAKYTHWRFGNDGRSKLIAGNLNHPQSAISPPLQSPEYGIS